MRTTCVLAKIYYTLTLLLLSIYTSAQCISLTAVVVNKDAEFYVPSKNIKYVQWTLGGRGEIKVKDAQDTHIVATFPIEGLHTITATCHYTDGILTEFCWTLPVVKQFAGGSIGVATTPIINTFVSLTDLLKSVEPGSGGLDVSSGYSYLWQKSTDKETWIDLSEQIFEASYGDFFLDGKVFFRRKSMASSEQAYSNTVEVDPIPVLFGGTISSSQESSESFQPAPFTGTLPTGNTGAVNYQWEYSTDQFVWQPLAGANAQDYAPPKVSLTTYFRRTCISGEQVAVSNVVQVRIKNDQGRNQPAEVNSSLASPAVVMTDYSAFSEDKFNKEISTLILKPGILDLTAANALNGSGEVQRKIEYKDGLSRVVQSVMVHANQKGADAVVGLSFNDFNEQTANFLPYLTNTGSPGSFKPDIHVAQPAFYETQNNDRYGYTIKSLEASSISRISSIKQPGKHFVGEDIATTEVIRLNNAVDLVRSWTVENGDDYLPVSVENVKPGTLNVTEAISEDGVVNRKYKDKTGKLLLETICMINGDPASDLRTYYVYDDMGRLRFVLPPLVNKYCIDNNSWSFSTALSQKVLSSLAYRYTYDKYGRVVTVAVPGKDYAGEVVYDSRDRIIFRRNPTFISRNKGEWTLNFFDSRDRKIVTGIYTDVNATRESLQQLVDQAELNNTVFTLRDPAPMDLVLDRYSGESVYEAQREILLLPGFEGQNFDAQINPSSVGGIQNISVNSFVPQMEHFSATEINYYDNYDFPGVISFDTRFQLDAGTNRYPEAAALSKNVSGKLTGSKIRNTNNDEWMTATSYYNNKGRLLQVVGKNYKNIEDVATFQYDYQGHEICSFRTYKNPSANNPVIAVQQRTDYNDFGLPSTSFVTLFNGNEKTSRQTHTYEYDDLGRIKTDQISNLESVDYGYDMVGRLKSINRDFVQNPSSNHYFGLELSYENGFSHPIYGGLLSGIKWRRKGDADINNAYGFTYDNAGRIQRADFSSDNGQQWTNENANFSLEVPAYDANGNIKRLKQYGMTVGGTQTLIDDLTYINENDGWSNRLQGVDDAGGDQHLNDFKNYQNRVDKIDYTYDRTGNLTLDKNKGVAVVNNFLVGKPEKIFQEATPGNAIEFGYTTTGNTVYRKVTEGANVDIYDYIGNAVYKNNELQYISIPGGRIRRSKNGNFAFDYFIFDHLGNNRVVLTDESMELTYLATHESTPSPKPAIPESELFAFPATPENIPNTHKFFDFGGQNRQFIRLKSNGNSPQIGTNKTLKVMAGDRVDFYSMYYYQQNSPSNNTPNIQPEDIAAQLIQTLLGPVSAIDGKASLLRSNTNGLILNKNELSNFIEREQNSNAVNEVPKAFLNYVIFDENFKFVDGGVKRVNTPDAIGELSGQLDIRKNGYLYVYLSNESPTDVYFDNLSIKHTTGPLIQEDSYYPFGLQINALSSRALNRMQNNHLFNGIERIDDLNLGIYDAKYRTLDPQLGRWWQVDPKSTVNLSSSPYLLSGNNPVNFADPLGDLWYSNGKGALKYFKGIKTRALEYLGEKYYRIGRKVSFKVADAIFTYNDLNLTVYEPTKLLGNEVVKNLLAAPIAEFGGMAFAKKMMERDLRIANNPHEKGTYTYWAYIHAIEYNSQWDAYHAWGEYSNYHEGESSEQYRSRRMSFGSAEARREYSSGGYNIFGGAANVERAVKATIETAEVAVVETAEVTTLEVVGESAKAVEQVNAVSSEFELVSLRGFEKAKPSGATPNSVYTKLDKTGKVAVSNYIYNGDGDVIYQVDFQQHGSALSGHGHILSPGDFSSGHGPTAPHIIWTDVPKEYIAIPKDLVPSIPLGGRSGKAI
ncbi:DUF6443 domain-containing protein [Chitinophaga sp. sic0106]|uniref:DUF6443 domain-containing protein n=1 Tax=Chitinophaga sp. sic0106 TaxID=2854785 RepID=UPI001C492170|nr:DUF6443 domain-containing protein [Chitinophaga sp. sic0106]MBV7530950.1 hypothetical protein [Chitinophaga sp. sic0106]